MRNWRRENLVDGSREFREIYSERSVGYALREKHQHDETRHDESTVINAIDLIDAMADGRTKHHEIKGCRDHWRNNALQQGALGARHFEKVDGAYGLPIHDVFPISSTKISSSELWRVCMSCRRNPPASTAASSRAT